jgi:hypothetical protein
VEETLLHHYTVNVCWWQHSGLTRAVIDQTFLRESLFLPLFLLCLMSLLNRRSGVPVYCSDSKAVC